MSFKLILVRHGESAPGVPDSQRPLTESGKEFMQAAARELQRHDFKIVWIWHSPRRRARETAQILAQGLEGVSLECASGLQPNDSAEALCDRLDTLAAEQDDGVGIVVGHLPQLDHVAAALVRKDQPPLRFLPGTMAHFTNAGHWQLDWIWPGA